MNRAHMLGLRTDTELEALREHLKAKIAQRRDQLSVHLLAEVLVERAKRTWRPSNACGGGVDATP